MKRNWKLLLILVCVVASGYYIYPTLEFYGLSDQERVARERSDPAGLADLHKRSLNLGLDLQGGIHLVMEVDVANLKPDEAQDAVDRAQEVIRNRVDQFGVAEPVIQRQGTNRIIVELPGIQDVQRAKNLVGQTALLEFKFLEPDEDRNRLIQRLDAVLGKEAVADTTAQADQGLFDEATKSETPTTGKTLTSYLGRYGNDVVVSARDLRAVKALLADPRAKQAVSADVELLVSSKPEGGAGNQFYRLFLVSKRAEMTGAMIQNAFVSVSQSVEYLGQHVVNLENTDEGTRLFSRITGSHVGDRLAIVLDGTVYSAPVIQDRIRDGRAIITGSETPEEAKDLAIVLRAGSLPAKVDIVEDRTVGPSLGRDSIEKSKVVGLYTLIVVAIFMLVYYRWSGVIADFALLLNMLFLMAILAGFHATITLPGIAGIVLTAAMAVDANVLIFERIREELRAGKTVQAAVEAGYQNALSAIIDGNVTTLIAGVVLYQFGTGPIRGFALTLCIGIASSLFTSVFITRTVFNAIIRRTQARTLSIGPLDFMAKVNIPFIGKYRWSFAFSALLLLSGLGSIFFHHGLRTGIDFAGGALLELHFDPAVKIEELRRELGSVQVGGQTANLAGIEIKQFGSPNDMMIRVTEAGSGSEITDGIMAKLRASFPGSIKEGDWIRRQEKVGPQIGSELRGAAVRAVIVSLILILIYMAWRFHRFIWGIAAVIATFHDVLITLGLISVLNIEITMAVIASLLTIVGYSLNDTIVVFDRIRENLRGRRRDSFARILDVSINETLSRTLITGLTTLFALLIMLAWGSEVIRDFNLVLLIGIVVGTYSSVFIASPILYIEQKRVEQAERSGATTQQ
ncbi:MAG: protein translocase subunit SecD [Candidatus Latescibacterota bacterium]|jgi:SecD/SecF fusion protein